MNCNFKTYKKIDIFTRGLRNKVGFIKYGCWVYECSTAASKTCKQAKQSFCAEYGLDSTQVKCNFAK